MKRLKPLAVFLLSLPCILAVIWVAGEIFGMCANHMATRKQTSTLEEHLEREIPDIEIIRLYSETGNTSGTGNHVECLSSALFSTQMQKPDIEERLSKYYIFDEWSCYVDKTEDGYYIIYVNTSAPFPYNIAGH